MNDTPATLRAFRSLWKRKWLMSRCAISWRLHLRVLQAPALKYKATTQLFLARANRAWVPAPRQRSAPASSTTRSQDQLIADRKGRQGAAASRGDIEAVHGTAIAAASPTSDFIVITTEDKTPLAAVQLANSVAQVYVARQKTAYLLSVKAQILTIREQIRRIESAPTRDRKDRHERDARGGDARQQNSQLESTFDLTGVQQYGLPKPSAADDRLP